jgi:predicted RNase H-like HicB family nuclease
MKVLNYRLFLRKEPEGGYTVIVPSLSGCVTYGTTLEESLEMAKDAIKLYIETLEANGEDIPVENEIIETTVAIKAHA